MAEITNLNRFRKEKAKSQARQKADANSVKYGLSKAQKNQDQLSREKSSLRLDQHKIGNNGDATEPQP